MNPLIDLVYFEGCPHVDHARNALRRALAAAGRPLDWREWRADDPELPAHAIGFGSPSIFLDGIEVTGGIAGDSADACRLYRGADGRQLPAPDPFQLAALLVRMSP